MATDKAGKDGHVVEPDGPNVPDGVGTQGKFPRIRAQLINLIGGTVVALFVIAWVWVLFLVWSGTPPEGEPVALGAALVVAVGTLTTTVGTLTASTLGFTIADVKRDPNKDVTVVNVGSEIPLAAAVAIVAYLLVGVAVLATWIIKESVSPELVVTFGFSILGWLVGGASGAFSTTTSAPNPSTPGGSVGPAATPAGPAIP